MSTVIDLASWALILSGSFFTVVGAFGLVRMPEIFTRMHAASVTDTMGVGLLILGMGLQAGFTLVTPGPHSRTVPLPSWPRQCGR